MNHQELQEAQRVAKLIIGYLNNDLTDNQRKELDEWLLESMDNIALFEKLTDENNVNEATEWFRQIDEQAALLKVRQKAERASTHTLHRLMWAAAALLVIFAGYWLWNKQETKNNSHQLTIADSNEVKPGSQKAILITESGKRFELHKSQNMAIEIGNGLTASNRNEELVYQDNTSSSGNTLEVPAGGQYKVVLADGTRVWLNALSTLKYPTSFEEGTRKLELEGEAYFEVAKNASKPFEVKFGDFTVQVTGTSFNINSYSDALQRVTLLEGGINLLSKGISKSIQPGQDAIISKEGNIIVTHNAQAAESIAWTKGLFSFNRTPIEEVMNQISRWYDVRVIYKEKPTKQFTGNIPMKSNIQTALQMLEISGSVHLSLSGKTITVNP